MIDTILFGAAAAAAALFPFVAIAITRHVRRSRTCTFVYHPDLRIWIPRHQYRIECARRGLVSGL